MMNHSLVNGHASLSERLRKQQQQHQDMVTSIMFSDHQDQVENEFRNIKLKLKGPNRHSELQAVKALMAMSAQQNLYTKQESDAACNSVANHHHEDEKAPCQNYPAKANIKRESSTKLARSESPEPIYGLSITMTEEEFKELAQREGIKDVIGDPICRLCGGLFSGPLGIALHMCPAMKRQTFRCEICGEDKWKTKANLHSHIKWCKKRLSTKIEQHESKQIY